MSGHADNKLHSSQLNSNNAYLFWASRPQSRICRSYNAASSSVIADPFRSSVTLGFSTIAGRMLDKIFAKIVLFCGILFRIQIWREGTAKQQHRATCPRACHAYSQVNVRWLLFSTSSKWRTDGAEWTQWKIRPVCSYNSLLTSSFPCSHEGCCINQVIIQFFL